MGRSWLAVVLLVCAMLAVTTGCSQPTEQTTPPEPEVEIEEPSGETTEQEASDAAAPTWQQFAGGTYREWTPAPGHDEPQAATGPHGETVQVFVNEPLESAILQSNQTEWPVGSELVKDVFGADGELTHVAIMQKTDEGWYYAEWTPDGTPVAEGLEIATCAGCHAEGADSVRTFGFQ